MDRCCGWFLLPAFPQELLEGRPPANVAAPIRAITLLCATGYPRHVESFNGKLRDEPLNIEIFAALWEAKVLAGR